MTNKARNNNQSFLEKSMKLVRNISKLSAISIAEKSVRTKPGPLPPPPTTTGSFPVMDATSLTVPESRRRSQEPGSGSKTSTYFMELPEETYVIREEGTTVDGRASDYIRGFHDRMRNDSITASKLSPILLPPTTSSS